jgi:hypothetical protein
LIKKRNINTVENFKKLFNKIYDNEKDHNRLFEFTEKFYTGDIDFIKEHLKSVNKE